jgi:peptidoglycan/LPS O-acetylase OafA/YrhL
MKKLGAYSYTIYIFQTAVMTILYFLLGLAGRNNWYSKTNFLITLVAITGFGIAMYHLWDKPIGDLIKKKEGELHEKH